MLPRADDSARSSAAGHCALPHDDLLRGDLDHADPVGNWRAWMPFDCAQSLRKNSIPVEDFSGTTI